MPKHSHHPFHLVETSPWPATGSLSAVMLVTGLAKWFHQFNMNLLLLAITTTVLTMYQWWRDITREATYQGSHTKKVITGLRSGMILFITSEVLFFFSFFWAFFHSSLTPTMDLGTCWPPLGLHTFNPFSIPLLNTAILLTSGATVTWTHHSLMTTNRREAIQSLVLTIILGLNFTAIQLMEYLEASFTIADSIYGATFFVATGFHGLHVIIGTAFLTVSLSRMTKYHFSAHRHFGFEAAAWYWHFVDVVWLFLYVSIYWWGG